MTEEVSAKRTRASGEVLDLLLLEFERNPNPLPDLRKEISERTGMNEKAVRIWFQNRRAKLRKFARMSQLLNSPVSSKDLNRRSVNDLSNMSQGGAMGTPLNVSAGPTSAPAGISNSAMRMTLGSRAFSEMSIPIAINEKYCFLDCLSLLVGLWQRIKLGNHDEQALRNKLVNLLPFTLNSTMKNVDLMVILSKRNQEINYFFLAISNYLKILFRIFYPVLSVLTCLTVDNNIKREHSELRLSLLHRPKFLVYFFNGINLAANQWSICDDFSEGQQVSHACFSEGGNETPHVLVGTRDSLQYLRDYVHETHNLGRAQNPTPPDSATSTTSLLPAKYHAQAQIQFDDPSHHGNLQFVTDEMNFWDEVHPQTPATSVSVNPPLVPLPNLEHFHRIKTTSVTGTPLSASSLRHQLTPVHDYGLYSEEPDFLSFDPQFENRDQQPQSTQPSTGHSSVSDHNSRSVNLVKNSHNVHSYTHTALHNNQYAVDVGANQMHPCNTFDLLEDTLHATELDFALVDENASTASNPGVANVTTDHNTPIDNSGAQNSSACSGLSNVDHFIDFGSNYP